MTDEELSRIIAEHLEPLKSLPNADECDFADMDEFDAKCWIATHRLSKVTLIHVPEWQPRNMVTDPAMAFKLMDAMRQEGMTVLIESQPDYQDEAQIHEHSDLIDRNADWSITVAWGDSNCPHPGPYNPATGHGFTNVTIIGAFGRAVAEVFAKARGLI